MRIYVGNLNFRTTQDQLQDLFSPYGQVDEVNIITDRETGRSRGFAFVTMADSAAAQAAIDALNGQDFDGRALSINEARPRTGNGGARGGRGFGGGEGGSYGGGGGGGGRDRDRGRGRDNW